MNQYHKLNPSNYLFKIIWGKRYVGIAIDKLLNSNQTLPITTFFFWPRENGWELLRNQLLSKPWITKEERINILNGSNKIINYWLMNVNRVEDITKLIEESLSTKFELFCSEF